MRLTHRIWLLAAVAACSATPKHPVSLALVVHGDPAATGALPPDAVAGLELRPVELPAPAPAPPDPSSELVTRARKAYAQGDFDACRAALANIDLVRLLAAGERTLASRAVTFESACAFGAQARTESQAAARKLASLGLELPTSAVSPDVENLIGGELTAAGKQARHPVAVTGELGARLAVDGRPAGCALPCTIDLAPGDHVLAVEADGFAPAARLVRIPDTTTIALAQPPATAELAARQWRARIGRGLPATDAVGAALIARLAGPRVLVLHGGAEITGAVVVDGVPRATAARPRGETRTLIRDLAYDGGILPRPRVWQRPWFWIAVTGATAIVAGVVLTATYEPEVVTQVKL